MARCTADSLDAAVDVCDDCGQPFCEDHLIRSRGARKKPLCRECAVVKAGLRHKDVRTSSASRSTVRKNRKMVKSSEVVEQEPAFEYFDLEDPSLADDDTEPAEPAKQKRRLRGRNKQDDAPETNETEDKPVASAQASAADLWEQIRTDGPETEAPIPTDDLAPPPPMAVPAAPEPDEWLEPGPFDEEPDPGMPATFDAPRSELPPPPSAPPAPTPPAPAAPTLAPSTPDSEPTAWVEPTEAAAEPVEPWVPAPVSELDLGFDSVDQVDSLGRPIAATAHAPAPEPEAAPEPTPAPEPEPRRIPPSFAERPTHALPAAFLKAVETDDTDDTTESDVPAALRPGAAVAPAVPDALRPR